MASSKPVIAWTKGSDYPRKLFWDASDFTKDTADKNYHFWGQGVEFPSHIIQKRTQENDLIIDPTCGAGATTCVAAKMLGRNYIGIDISEEYCEIARMRLKAVETGVSVAEQKQGQRGLFE